MLAKLNRVKALPLLTRLVSLILLGAIALLILARIPAGPPQPESNLFPPPAEADRLNEQVWSWLGRAECPRPAWSPDFTSEASYRKSVEPLRAQLLARTGAMPDVPRGDVIERRVVTGTSSYSIEWLRIGSRLPGVSVSGYLARPLSGAQAQLSPSVIIVPGVGVPPHSLFGWRLTGDEQYVKYAGPTQFSAVGQELIRAGYAVFAPWINDERGNYPGTHWEERDWPRFPWFELSAWGAVQRLKANQGGEQSLVVPGLIAAVDFFERERKGSPVALVGWEAGAHLAAVTAAIDERADSVALLGPVVDTRAVFADPAQLKQEAPFTMLGCSFGDYEMAAMIAPRPLLFAMGKTDPLYIRRAADSSDEVYGQIEQLYGGLSPGNVERIMSDGQSAEEARIPAEWMSQALGYEPLLNSTAAIHVPRPPSTWWYSEIKQHTVRREMISHLDKGNACQPVPVLPDFSSVEGFTRSMQPARQELVADVVGQLLPEEPVVVLERSVVRSQPEYTLEWVRFRGRFADLELGGYLATPNVPDQRLPAVLSFDGNYDQAWLYDLKSAPFVYLNAYGDALARSGYVVFSPYMPSTLADGWGAILGAKTGNAQTVWSYLVPLYMSGVDLLRAEPAVDRDRIAAYGISYAGTAALLTAMIDERIAAVVHSNPFGGSRPQRVVNGPYLMPTIWGTELCPYTSLLNNGSLIAPRVFIWENGLRDDNAPQRYEPERVAPATGLYKRLGLPDRFRLARHDGGHETRPQVTVPILDLMLGVGD